MKCTNCGAVIKDGSKFCEFCGAQISAEMRREQEQVNKEGCPKCGSGNISFSREKQGEVKGKAGTSVVRSTVGVCKDCGYTWSTTDANGANKKNNMIWWVLGWIFFFPAPVMVLIWRKKCTWSTKVKIAVTIAFWLVFLILGASGSSDDSSSSQNESTGNADKKITVEAEAMRETEAPASELGIGDVANIKDVQAKVSAAILSKGEGSFTKPDEGKLYLCLILDISNESAKDITVSSLMSFEAYCDDYSINQDIIGLQSPEVDGLSQLDGTVAAGKKMNGVICYQVPENFEIFELKFSPSFWGSQSATFVINAENVDRSSL